MIRAPLDLAIEVTYKCNLDCSYCYAYPRKGRDPSFEEVKYMIDYASFNIRPFELVLGGGEPFIRRDFLQILDYACKVKGDNTVVEVISNGTLFNEPLIKELKKLQTKSPFGLQISLDSYIPEIHNKVRGKYDETMQGLRNLQEEGLDFIIGTVVHAQNIDTLPETLENLYERGFRNFHFMNIMPSSVYRQNFNMLSVDKVKLKSFWKRIIERSKEFKGLYFVHPYKDQEINLEENFSCEGCLAGTTRSVIKPNGDIIPCDMVRDHVFGNVFKDKWEDIWFSEKAEDFRKEKKPLCLTNLNHYDKVMQI